MVGRYCQGEMYGGSWRCLPLYASSDIYEEGASNGAGSACCSRNSEGAGYV